MAVRSQAIDINWPAYVWAVLTLGLAALFGPTYWRVAMTLWGTEEHAHGPIILLVAVWLLWKHRAEIIRVGEPAGASALCLLCIGLLFYIVGRSQEILLFEIGAQVPILIGTIALIFGWQAAHAAAVPILFILFLIPLPEFIATVLTSDIKTFVSSVAEALLYGAGYPVARQGVSIFVGPYQLLIVDACAGLYSIFSLTAIGLVYLYLTRPGTAWRNAILVASFIPVAMVANVCRVVLLILVTYHFGAEAGQGLLHQFAGITLFLTGLALLLAIDWVLRNIFSPRKLAAS